MPQGINDNTQNRALESLGSLATRFGEVARSLPEKVQNQADKVAAFSLSDSLVEWANDYQDPYGKRADQFYNERTGKRIPTASSSIDFCHPKLKKVVDEITHTPETARLLQEAGKGGGIRFEVATRKFEASWSTTKRTITIDPSLLKKGRESDLVAALIFELTNACSNDEFQLINERLARGGFASVNDYVREIERVEFKTALRSSGTIDGLIANKAFPHYNLDSRRHWTADFDSYYLIQQLHGHSQPYAQQFYKINPVPVTEKYKGTLPNDLSAEDRQALLAGLTSHVWNIKHPRRVSPETFNSSLDELKPRIRALHAEVEGGAVTEASKAAERQLEFLRKVFTADEWSKHFEPPKGLHVVTPDPDELENSTT